MLNFTQPSELFVIGSLSELTFPVYDSLTGEVVRRLQGHKTCVRDVSWHPYQPEILSSSVSTVPKSKISRLTGHCMKPSKALEFRGKVPPMDLHVYSRSTWLL